MNKFLLFLIVNLMLFYTGFAAAVEPSDIYSDDIFNYSKVTDSNLLKERGAFVWIQDLHKDPDVQKNIYKIIESLSKNKNIGNIYLEGLYSDTVLDISFIKNIPDSVLRERTVQALLNDGILSGSEGFAALNDKVKILGIEDRKIYNDNLNILNSINNEREINTYITDKIISFCDEAKNNYIPYTIPADITDINGLNISDNYPNLKKQQAILTGINKIDKKDFKNRFEAFIKDISKEADKDKVAAILKDIKTNTSYGYKKAYDIVSTVKKELLQQYKDIVSFLKLNSELFEINPIQLMEEYDKIKKDYFKLFNLPDNEFIDLKYFSKILKQFVTADINYNQYNELKNNKRYISYLFNKYLPADLKSFALFFLNDKNINTFHENNVLRNNIFIKNILKNADSKKINIVIAGGFHSEIANKFKELNKSYIVLTPNVAFTSAFNKLFSSKFTNTSTEREKIEAITPVIKEWSLFFSNPDTFQQQINSWLQNVNTLKNFRAKVSSDNDNFYVTIELSNRLKEQIIIPHSIKPGNDETTKTFYRGEIYSKYLQEYTLKKFKETASKSSLFGKKIKVVKNEDDSLLESSLLMPITVTDAHGGKKISINEKFIRAISIEDDSLIEVIVNLLTLYSSPSVTQEEFSSFISKNKDALQTIYAINANLIKENSVKSKVKLLFRTKEMPIGFDKDVDKALKNKDDNGMLNAIRQAELARQTRSSQLAMIQPPVGAYITDENGITGKGFNRTDGVLHAETYTIINYLKNYILANEMLPDGKLTEKGNMLIALLEMIIENGTHIEVKSFFKNKELFENFGISIEYNKNGHITKCKRLEELQIKIKEGSKRTTEDVFNETNMLLSLINSQLGSPLSSCNLYCTLAPCNKCVSTMVALKIGALYYASPSRNSYHKSEQKLKDNGIGVHEELLVQETTPYLEGYTAMNKSKIRTKIASFLQYLRSQKRKLSLSKNTETLKTLSDKISDRTEKTAAVLTELKTGIDWANITTETNLLKLEKLLIDIDAWYDPVKRAGIIYILSHKDIKIQIMNDKQIHFLYKGKILPGIYINQANNLVVSDNYRAKMERLAKVRNVADMDDNLAQRKVGFSGKMQKVLNSLILYGIASPIVVTGNTIEQTRDIRFASLGETTPKLIDMFFIEHGAVQYLNKGTPDTPLEERFKRERNYIMEHSKAFIDEKTISALEKMFKDHAQTWFDLLIKFLDIVKEQSNDGKANIEYDTIIDKFDEEEKFNSIFIPVLNSITGEKFENWHALSEIWQTFNRQQAKEFLIKTYNAITKEKKLKTSDFISIMRSLSIFEMTRIYFSGQSEDEDERKSLNSVADKYLTKNELPVLNPLHEVNEPTRFVISPMYPILVREIFVDYFKEKVEEINSELEIKSSGKSTININKKGISKRMSLSLIAEQAGTADTIIYTGDDFTETGVDYPVYQMSLEAGNMLVINTDKTAHMGSFLSLINIDDFSSENSTEANIDRSVWLQKMILDILERNILGILTDESFMPENIVQALRYELTKPEISIIDVENTKIESSAAMLKAG